MQQDDFRTRRARELRRDMTPTEMRLWYHLRGRRFAAYKFRRQTPIAGFIVDFYCARTRLIIELDGESHVGKEASDADRKNILEGKGFRVLRIWDTHVYEDLEAVMEMIWNECEARRSISPPTRIPKGERGENKGP